MHRYALFFGLSIALSACWAHAAPPKTARSEAGLVGQWRFDHSDGQTVRDGSGRGNDGKIEFGTLLPERGGKVLELDGLGGHVLVSDKTPLGLDRAVTTMLWVQPTELKRNTVLFGIPNAIETWSTPVYGMYVNEGKIVFGLGLDKGKGKTLVESPAELPLRAWSCLVGSYDGAVARLYINGVEVAQKTTQGAIIGNGQPLMIGMGRGPKPSLKGRIGELRIYNRALGAAEVKGLFDLTKTAYDLSRSADRPRLGGTVMVETHGNSPDADRPWIARPTRLLELLKEYQPKGQPPLDEFGGRTDLAKEKATGFFYTKKMDGRDWLIDPLGNRFYHVAINAVREPRNVNKLFGSPDQWAESITRQLRGAGFNGLGNWSTTRMQTVPKPLVWVLRKDFMFSFAREKKLTEAAAGTVGFVNRCMPVFHPEFEAHCDRFGRDLAATADDPTLLGIMTDNELQCPTTLLDRYLELDESNPDLKPNRDAAAAWLKARYGSADKSKINQHDRYEFIAFAFERYYRIVTAAVRKYDRNHMYLGSRLNYHTGEFDNPWLWKMLARYHDVVSVNYYGCWGPDPDHFANWKAWADRPLLLTEWYAKAMDAPGLANRFGAGWLVRTQEDRARYYQHFTLGALETPNIVGWHFFKYMDDPAESKALDSAGGANKGMFNLEGQPYAPLFERAKAVNHEVYPLIEFFDKRRS